MIDESWVTSLSSPLYYKGPSNWDVQIGKSVTNDLLWESQLLSGYMLKTANQLAMQKLSTILFRNHFGCFGWKKCLCTYKNALDTSFFLQLLNSFNDPLQICVTALVIVNAVKSKPLLLEGTVVWSYCKARVLHWIWCQLIESCTLLDSDLEHELHWLSEFWWCKNITIILLGHFHVHVSKPLCFCQVCVQISKKCQKMSKMCKFQKTKCVFAESKAAFVFDIYKNKRRFFPSHIESTLSVHRCPLCFRQRKIQLDSSLKGKTTKNPWE